MFAVDVGCEFTTLTFGDGALGLDEVELVVGIDGFDHDEVELVVYTIPEPELRTVAFGDGALGLDEVELVVGIDGFDHDEVELVVYTIPEPAITEDEEMKVITKNETTNILLSSFMIFSLVESQRLDESFM
ncbi:MAG: hypothetical protein K9M10_03925 [Candidatus Pacebacteria bacterium]|nr:hypothetical protein [Candidatus Paceibacterota bacterium]MCF7857596.1 hypothetical protein [Candidatus Paceibacterota bacterium]